MNRFIYSGARIGALVLCLLSTVSNLRAEDDALQMPELNIKQLQKTTCKVTIEVRAYVPRSFADMTSAYVFSDCRILNLDTKQTTVHAIERGAKGKLDFIKLELPKGRYAVATVFVQRASGIGKVEVEMNIGFEISDRLLGRATRLVIDPQEKIDI